MRIVFAQKTGWLGTYRIVFVAAVAMLIFGTGLCALQAAANPASNAYIRKDSWAATMIATREALCATQGTAENKIAEAGRIWTQMEYDFPVEWDWVDQDNGLNFASWFAGLTQDLGIERQMIERVLGEITNNAPTLRSEWSQLSKQANPSNRSQWLEFYARLCESRRGARLKTVLAQAPKMVFLKHHTVMPSFFAYTEGQSDAQNERHFLPDSQICLLEIDGLRARTRTLLSDPNGAIRDPAISYDAKRVLFSWKKSLNEDDYHLYEMNLETSKVRQITSGLGFADYEGCYLPNDDIVFTSTRCVQTVDCWWTEVSNLYTCDANGKYLRRLGFDQVHTLYPTVTADGRILYTRWDYNDRGQIFPQGLFQMNFDGTGQSEFYGNNSWFPTTIGHARAIPGTTKAVAIFMGHHTPQAGKLGLLDPSVGRQENSGAKLIAPPRETPAVHVDQYGQDGELFQYPYPLNEREFIVTYAPKGWEKDNRGQTIAHFSVYYMNVDGRRELLTSDATLPCCQPVPVMPRQRPALRPTTVDYRQDKGICYVQDIYAGPGLKGVSRGSIKKLRVVALEYRPAGVGNNSNGGEAGGAMVSTPIAVGNACWDVKVVLGDARVFEDGSASFYVPARMPHYFQALDAQGRVVQTMRSWNTLQPGEQASCVGCHENKNSAPPPTRGLPLALAQPPQTLEPFYGPTRGFSFAKEIQPILDRKCVSCHNDREAMQQMTGRRSRNPTPGKNAAGQPKVFSLLGETNIDPVAKRAWSDAYLALTHSRRSRQSNEDGAYMGVTNRLVNWISPQSAPPLLPPFSAGSATSDLIPLLKKDHYKVELTREELDKFQCWIDLLVPYCGDYAEAAVWTDEETAKYRHFLEKRRAQEEFERSNIQEMLSRRAQHAPQSSQGSNDSGIKNY